MNPCEYWPATFGRVAKRQPHIDSKAVLVEVVVCVYHTITIDDVLRLRAYIAILCTVQRAISAIDITFGERFRFLPSSQSSWRLCIWDMCKSSDAVGKRGSLQLAMKSEVERDGVDWLHHEPLARVKAVGTLITTDKLACTFMSNTYGVRHSVKAK